MKRLIGYAIAGIFLLVIICACYICLGISQQAFADEWYNFHFPDHPFSQEAIRTSIIAGVIFLIGYGGYYIVSITKISHLSFEIFLRIGFMIQAIFGVVLFASTLEAKDKTFGIDVLVIILLLSPWAITKLKQLAQ